MWIKTCDGNYINTDWISSFVTHGGDTYATIGTSTTRTPVSRTEDLRATIIQNIISGTKIMEVK